MSHEGKEDIFILKSFNFERKEEGKGGEGKEAGREEEESIPS